VHFPSDCPHWWALLFLMLRVKLWSHMAVTARYCSHVGGDWQLGLVPFLFRFPKSEWICKNVPWVRWLIEWHFSWKVKWEFCIKISANVNIWSIFPGTFVEDCYSWYSSNMLHKGWLYPYSGIEVWWVNLIFLHIFTYFDLPTYVKITLDKN
jgi:hypothetical protein